jgi:hypothetical protein
MFMGTQEPNLGVPKLRHGACRNFDLRHGRVATSPKSYDLALSDLTNTSSLSDHALSDLTNTSSLSDRTNTNTSYYQACKWLGVG